MSAQPPALVAKDLTKTYDDLVALQPMSITVPSGQSMALIGHNGSGKSTFLRMVAGLLDASGGEIEIAGFELSDVEARATTSFLPDDPVLYDDLSLREHAEYISKLHGGDGWDDYAESLCVRLGLEERIDDLPSRFSRGLRQKTSIVLALVRPFSLLLVDEPFVGLDQPGKLVLLELLADPHTPDRHELLLLLTHLVTGQFSVAADPVMYAGESDDDRLRVSRRQRATPLMRWLAQPLFTSTTLLGWRCCRYFCGCRRCAKSRFDDAEKSTNTVCSNDASCVACLIEARLRIGVGACGRCSLLASRCRCGR